MAWGLWPLGWGMFGRWIVGCMCRPGGGFIDDDVYSQVSPKLPTPLQKKPTSSASGRSGGSRRRPPRPSARRTSGCRLCRLRTPPPPPPPPTTRTTTPRPRRSSWSWGKSCASAPPSPGRPSSSASSTSPGPCSGRWRPWATSRLRPSRYGAYVINLVLLSWR